MTESKIDSAQTKSRYSPLPDGVYDMNILGAKKGTSKKGHPMATVAMTPMGSPYQGKKVYYHIMLEDRYKEFSRSFFEALSLGHVSNLDEFDYFDLVGQKVRALLKVERKDGLVRQKFVKFFPFRQDTKTLPLIPEDLYPPDVALSETVRFSRGSIVIRGFRYSGEKDNKKAWDKGRKLASVLNYFLKYLRDHYGME